MTLFRWAASLSLLVVALATTTSLALAAAEGDVATHAGRPADSAFGFQVSTTTVATTTVAAFEQSSIEAAVQLAEGLSVNEAARLFEDTQTDRVVDVIALLPIETSAEISSLMAPVRAGAVMERLPSKWATEIVELVTEDRLIPRLPEVSPTKMWQIPLSVLLDNLPSVPVMHLDFWLAPQVAAGLSGPTSRQVAEGVVEYTVPDTVAGGWAQVVASPAPFDSILARFNRRLTDVKFDVTNLEQRPPETTELPPGRIANSFLKVEVRNAEPEDISVVATFITVEKSWLDANQVHKWSIEFSRFDASLNTWTPFQSKRMGEDEDRVLFAVVLPGFSNLAITGSREIPERIFEVTELEFSPWLPRPSDEITVSGRVTNKSAERAVFPAHLWIDNKIKKTQTVEVGPGESAPFSFTFTKPAGTYKVRVERQVAELKVTTLAAALPSTGGVAPSAGGLVALALAGMALVAGGVWLAFGAGKRARGKGGSRAATT